MNSIYQQKSEFNFEAAKLLHGKALYNPSVHASYYGVFQYMQFLLHRKLKINWERLNTIKNSGYCQELNLKTIEKRGSHKLIEELIRYKINSDVVLRNDLFDFNNKIKQIKRMREHADYQEIILNSQNSSQAINLSKELEIILNKQL